MMLARTQQCRLLRCRLRSVASQRTYASSQAEKLREIIKAPGVVPAPGVHDALTAHLCGQSGFNVAFMSGFTASATQLRAPDTGLMSFGNIVYGFIAGEALSIGRGVCAGAPESLLLIADADDGYGNAVNAKRTVREFAKAGFSGILIEDQEAPKACGHVGERRVVNKGNAIQKVRAASDARDEGADVLIFARTDARGPEGIQGAVERAQAYAKEGGADVVFADALRAEPEIEQFAKAQSVPVLANMLEGGGKTPVLPPEHLERLGVNIAAYPLSLLGVYITAVQRALEGLKHGKTPEEEMPSFEEIKASIGFPEYFAEAARYASSDD